MKLAKALGLSNAALSVFNLAAAADNCKGGPNERPIWNDEPRLIKSVPNGDFDAHFLCFLTTLANSDACRLCITGKLFMAGSSELNNEIHIAHVYGNSYGMFRLQRRIVTKFLRFYYL